MPIVSALSISRLMIQPEWKGKICAEIDDEWLKFAALDLNLSLTGEIFLPRGSSTSHLDTSSSEQIGFPIVKHLSTVQNLRFVPFVRHASLFTSIENQNEWNLGMNVFLDWNTK